MIRRELNQRFIDVRLALEVLDQIQEAGIDSVRVSTVADRLEVSIGSLYRRWGHREFLLEHTWRTCVASVDTEVVRAIPWVTEKEHSLEVICERIEFGLPKQLEAFFELHSARRKWQRELEPDGMVAPSLVLFAELNVRYGHFRKGNPRIIAGTIWWVMTGALNGPGRFDVWKKKWVVETLRRGLLSRERLEAEDPIESLEITVEESPEESMLLDPH